MYLLPIPREQFLFLLPREGTVAEVGVARGDFSRQILDRTAPERLHLIDPWIHQAREDYANDPNNWSDEEGDAVHHQVSVAFAGEVAAGRVVIHRAFSTDVAPTLPDESLDWVYIDGMHTRDAVAADLEAFHAKIKPDGLILGHDYAKHPEAQAMDFGVVEAVNAFVRERNCVFVALTNEFYPTYVLARLPGGEAERRLSNLILRNIPGVIEIDDFANRTWEHTIHMGPNNVGSALIKF